MTRQSRSPYFSSIRNPNYHKPIDDSDTLSFNPMREVATCTCKDITGFQAKSAGTAWQAEKKESPPPVYFSPGLTGIVANASRQFIIFLRLKMRYRNKKDLFQVLLGGPLFALILSLAFPMGASAQVQYVDTQDFHTTGNANCNSEVDLYLKFQRDPAPAPFHALTYGHLNTEINFFGQTIPVRDLWMASYSWSGSALPTQLIYSSTFGTIFNTSNNNASWAWGGSSVTSNPTFISYSYPVIFGGYVNLTLLLDSIDNNDLRMGIYGGNGTGAALNGMVSTELRGVVYGSLVTNFSSVKFLHSVKSSFDLYKYNVRIASKVHPAGGGAYARTVYGPATAKVFMNNFYKLPGGSWTPWYSTPLWNWTNPPISNTILPYTSF